MSTKEPHNERGIVHTQSESYSKVPIDLTHDLRLTDGAVRLYAHMRWRYGHDQNNFEGRASMGEELGVSETTISKRIKELEAAGWVVTVERKREGTNAQQTNVYHVFEVQSDSTRFRKDYQPSELEFVRPRPAMPKRKSRKGIGGKPSHVNLSSPGDPDKPEFTPPVNSSSQNLDAHYLDAKDSLADANAPQAPRFAVGDVVYSTIAIGDDAKHPPYSVALTVRSVMPPVAEHSEYRYILYVAEEHDSCWLYESMLTTDPPTPPDDDPDDDPPDADALDVPDAQEGAGGEDDALPDWNEVRQAFLDVQWCGSREVNYYVNMNFGRAAKGKWAVGNIAKPMTPEQIQDFPQWWRKDKRKGGAGMGDASLPKDPLKFGDYVEQYQAWCIEREAREIHSLAPADDFAPPSLTPTVSYSEPESVAA